MPFVTVAGRLVAGEIQAVMPNPVFLDAVIGAKIIAETVRALVSDVSSDSQELEVRAKVSVPAVTQQLQWKPLVIPMAQERAIVLVLCGVTPADTPMDGPTTLTTVVYNSRWDGKSQYVTLRNGTQTVTTTIVRGA
jgi:hypothetical protein